MQSISVQRTPKKTGHFSIKRFILRLQLLYDDENDDEIQRLLEEKAPAAQGTTRKLSKKTAYSNVCKTKLRDMQDSWMRKKTEEIQSFVDGKDMKKFHDALKTIYHLGHNIGPNHPATTFLLLA